MLNVFATAESDLALRVRSMLGGGASRMDMRARVLAGISMRLGDRATRDGDLDAVGREIRAAIERGEITAEEGREKWEAVQRLAADKQDKEAIDLDAIGLKIRAAIANGDITAEEGRAKMDALRQRLEAGEKDRATVDLDAIGREIRELVAKGELTAEQGREKMEAARRWAAGEDDADKRHAERVWNAAMATDPDEWSEELKAAILELMPEATIAEIAAGIRQRQAAGNTVTDVAQILIDLTTSVDEASWGQIKKDVIEGE